MPNTSLQISRMHSSPLEIRTEYWMKPIPLRDFDYIARITALDGDSKYWGNGKTHNLAVLDLLRSLYEVEQFETQDFTIECPTCGGTKQIEVTHHLYGSSSCFEPTEDIQCPTCEGRGELISDIETLLQYLKEECR